MLDLIIEQRRIPQLLEEKILHPKEEYWIIDLDTNGLVYTPLELKKLLTNEVLSYLDNDYQIMGVKFFTYVKDKLVLIVMRSC